MKFIFLLLLLSSCSSSLGVHEYNQETQRKRMERHDKQSRKEMYKERKKHAKKRLNKRKKRIKRFI